MSDDLSLDDVQLGDLSVKDALALGEADSIYYAIFLGHPASSLVSVAGTRRYFLAVQCVHSCSYVGAVGGLASQSGSAPCRSV